MAQEFSTNQVQNTHQVQNSSHGRRSDIAVVGMSAWYPCGNNLKDFWANVLARRRAFRRLPERRLSHLYYDSDPLAPDKTYVTKAAVIDGFDFDWAKRRVPKRVYESADLVHWFALEMAIRAIEDAGYDKASIPNTRMGVIVGNTLTGEISRANGLRLRWPYVARAFRTGAQALGYSHSAVNEMLAVTEDVFKSAFPNVTEDTLPGVIPNTIAGRICNYFDMKGGGYAVDGACASSLIAIAHAADALTTGKLDMALAGGIDMSIDPFELIGFAKIGALAKEDMYVYEQRSQGFFPGEGCGWVMLKRLEDAQRAGDYIYATLKGWGISSDGRGGLTAPNVEGQVFALERAYEQAGYTLADVDFVEGHGTGTPVGDLVELSALAQALQHTPGARPLGVTALKSLIGHCKAAAGIGSFIKTVLAVNQRVVPPLANCEKPHPVFAQTPLYPILEGRQGAPTDRMRAGVSSFGFGGINVHMTVESAAAPHPKLQTELEPQTLFASSQDSEVFFFCAATPEELQAQVRPLVSMAHQLSEAEMTDLAAHLAKEVGQGALRAALVAATPEELAHKLETLLYLLNTPPATGQVQFDPLREVWLSNERQQCRVGFLFPGQGSQKLNMAQSLVQRFDWAQATTEQANRAVGALHGQTLTELIYRPTYLAKGPDEIAAWTQQLVQTEVCQPAICLASVLYTQRLTQLGILPHAVGGHSLGELTAFWAASALTLDELFALARLRGQGMAAADGARGAMASLRCPLSVAEKLLRQVAEYVVVANINSDEQTVVSGDPVAIDALLACAAQEGIQGQRLQVSNAFHSRYVAPGAAWLARSINLAEQTPPLSAKLFSGMNGRQVNAGDALQAHFPQQIVEQVDFIQLGTRLAAESDLLIEVGPGRVLSKLLEKNRAAQDVLCLPVELEPGKYKAFHQVVAACFVHGVPVNMEALFAQRLTFPFIDPEERNFIENPCESELLIPEIPESFDRSFKGAFEALLPERTGYDKSVIEAYLETRRDFLTEVVRADLATAKFDQTLTASAALPDLPSSKQRGEKVGKHNDAEDSGTHQQRRHGFVETNGASINGGQETKSNAALGASTKHIDNAQAIIENLTQLIAERTGFALESIRPEMTLLNDLNIESIAAGEIIARTAHAAGVGSQLDPGQLLQASLQQVADAIHNLASGGRAPSSAAVPIDAADKSGLLATLGKLNGKSSWVRAFDICYTAEPLPKPAADDYVQRLENQSVVVISMPKQACVADPIVAAFQATGAQVRRQSYAELAASPGPAPALLVALLPITERTGEVTLEKTQTFMNCLVQAANWAGTSNTTLIYLQFGGGYFHTKPEQSSSLPFSAAAFAASLHHERRQLRIRVLDCSADFAAGEGAQFTLSMLAEKVVDEVVHEPEDGTNFVRAGYDRTGVRYVPRPVVRSLHEGKQRAITWSPQDVMVVTGGAKGITAEIALAMALKTGVRTVLLGSSPALADAQDGKKEIVRTLQRFQEKNLDAYYLCCNVVDAAEVANTFMTIRNEIGAITGVIHGAGMNRPALVGNEKLTEAYQTIAPKVMGLRNILTALHEAPPKMIIGLSSIIGFTGMPGNSWYGFANELLERMLQQARQANPALTVLALGYSLWEKVGMGIKLEGVAQQIQRMGASAIPVDEGTRYFLELVERDLGSESMVVAARLGGLDTWHPDPMQVPPLRFLEEILTAQPHVEVVAKAHLALEKDPYLHDHVYKGSYLFPMVFGLEAMAQAVAALTGKAELGYVRIEAIDLERPIVVDAQKGVDILIHAEALEPKAASAEWTIRVGIACQQTNFTIDHFAATFVLTDADVAAPSYPIARPAERLKIDPVPDLYGRFLFHGPQFQRLQNFYALRSDYCIFEAEERQATPDQFILGDPFFRDALLQAGQIVIPQDRGLPRAIGAIELYPHSDQLVGYPLVEGVLNWRTEKEVDCTITVTDGRDRVLQRLQNCLFSILEHLPDEPTAEEIAAPSGRDEQLLQAQLQRLTALKIKMPEVTIANLPGLHKLPALERHSREQFVLERVVTHWQHTNGAKSGIQNGAPVGVPGGIEARLEHV